MLLAHGSIKNIFDTILRVIVHLFIVISIAMILSCNLTLAKSIELTEANLSELNLSDHLYYTSGSDTPVTIEQILAFPTENFIANKPQPHSPQLGQHSLYRINLTNSGKAKSLILQVDNPMLDDLRLYQVIDNKLVYQELLGDEREHEFRLKNSLPHFNLNFPANSESILYIRAYAQGSTIMPITLKTEQSFQKAVYERFITWGAFIGIILVMMAYNGLLYFGIRDKVYLFYLGYIVTMLIELGVIYGYGFHIFPFELQNFFHNNLLVFNYVVSIFAILFALYFLRYENQESNLLKYSLYFCLLLALLAVTCLFIPESMTNKIYYPFQLAVYLVIGRICLPKIFDGLAWSTYYLLSWIPLFIGTTIAQLLLLDMLPHNYFTQNALLFGLILEIGFISLALAERFRAYEAQRIYKVTHDSATGLPNNVLLNECISRQIAQTTPFTLILFQAERFSEIKPALGLVAASNFVTAVVNNVSDYFRQMSSLYVFEYDEKGEIHLSRVTDDIFGLMLTGEHEHEELSYIVLTIQEAVSTPINVGGYNVSTQCTVGLVSFPQYGINADMLIQQGKHALDIARKEDSKMAFYRGDQNLHIQEQLQLMADLQKAIDNDLLEIYHQPQIDIETGTVCGNEALLRWHHQTRGFISPEVFVSLAEETGMITQLTEWVISRSLEQHAKMIAAGFEQNISINLSAKDLTQPGLIVHIMTTLADLALDPKSIIFELTESATSDDPVHAQDTIIQLHDLKLKIAIDDFGTGYSSLEYLSKLPFHELKVDKSFILDIMNSKRDQAITKTTIEMAKNLGIFVVAEGVETEEIESLLRSYGCEIGQGYLYSKPLPIDDFINWLQGDSPYVQKLTQSNNEQELQLAHN